MSRAERVDAEFVMTDGRSVAGGPGDGDPVAGPSWPSVWWVWWMGCGPVGCASILLDQVDDVLIATLEQTPPNATHWSRTAMGARSGLSPSTIGRIWRKFELTREPTPKIQFDRLAQYGQRHGTLLVRSVTTADATAAAPVPAPRRDGGSGR
jgi:hypothetical protein